MLPWQGAQCRSLVREPRSHMPCGVAKKKKRKCKMSHIPSPVYCQEAQPALTQTLILRRLSHICWPQGWICATSGWNFKALFCFKSSKIDFIFSSSFMFLTKLRGSYRGSPYAPYMPSPLHYQHPQCSAPFVITDEPWHVFDHPKYIVYIRIHSWFFTSYENSESVNCSVMSDFLWSHGL